MTGKKEPKINFYIFIVSFLILFLEISFIRWISSEIRIFAYLNNLVLLACFLGIGIGCYLSRESSKVIITLIMLAFIALSIKFGIFTQITDDLSGFEDAVIWWSREEITFFPIVKGIFSTLTLFLVILFLFVPLGQIVAKLLDEHKNPILGYSINIVGGILGIWVFNLLSFLNCPPLVWTGVSLILILILTLGYPIRILLLSFLLSISIFLISIQIETPLTRTTWSPYQKLTVTPNYFSGLRNGYMINVNNAGYMSVLDLSDEFIREHPAQYDYNLKKYGQYDMLYRFKNEIKDVLIVGAGAGNDAASALRNTSAKIDAVEIDPVIYRLGLAFHPENPYQNKRVRVFINDTRSFFKKSKKKYDLISFGLLDSVTLGSSYTNTRLDHYVYTRESFLEVKKLLAEDGILSVVFEVKKPWIGARIQGLLEETFGQRPFVFKVDSFNRPFARDGIMFVISNDMSKLEDKIGSTPHLREYIEKNKVEFNDKVKLTSDNWPYLYLKKPLIPRLHLCITLVIFILFILAATVLSGVSKKMNLHFFFLGSGFLLLEFQNVNKASLLFGSTWLVNSYTISAILLLILLANLFAAKIKIKNIKAYYILLMLTVVINYLVPLRIFNLLSGWQKIALSNIVLNLPVFFAGVIFINSFSKAPRKDIALGSNLLGTMLGGVLESVSFVAGIKALLLAVLTLYIFSYVSLRRNA